MTSHASGLNRKTDIPLAVIVMATQDRHPGDRGAIGRPRRGLQIRTVAWLLVIACLSASVERQTDAQPLVSTNAPRDQHVREPGASADQRAAEVSSPEVAIPVEIGLSDPAFLVVMTAVAIGLVLAVRAISKAVEDSRTRGAIKWAQTLPLDPPAIIFPVLKPGQTAVQTIVMTNRTGAPVRVLGLSSAGREFSLVTPMTTPVTIPPDGQMTVTVRFEPHRRCHCSGDLAIDLEPQYGRRRVPLRGQASN